MGQEEIAPTSTCRRGHIVFGVTVMSLAAGLTVLGNRTVLTGTLLPNVQRQGIISSISSNDSANYAAVPWWGITPSTSSHSHGNTAAARRRLARLMLQQMEQRGAMQTPFTNRTWIVHDDEGTSSVFPRQWRPCVLEEIFQRKTPLTITVVGGSTVARPGNCSASYNFTDPHGGRYSNLLEWGLRQDSNSSLKLQVINMGQGGEVSTRGAFFLDRTIDALETDVLIWDYFLNDDMQRSVPLLDFWLTRVKAHYGQASRPPPPIILLYLWEFKAKAKLLRNESNTVNTNPIASLGRLIDAYRQLGWNIAAVNVGAAVNATAVKTNVGLLFDDNLHPSCRATHLIADLLEHAILSNLAAECSADELSTTNSSVMVPAHNETTPPKENPLLWQDLWNENARIGSISPWKPQLGTNRSNLCIASNTLFAQQILYRSANQSWTLVPTGKSDPSREDRKYGYRIPRCSPAGAYSNTSLTLELTIQVANLKWLGLALDGPAISITINNNLVPPARSLELYARPYLSRWINLDRFRGKELHVNLCHQASEAAIAKAAIPPNLQYLLGVSVPKGR